MAWGDPAPSSLHQRSSPGKTIGLYVTTDAAHVLPDLQERGEESRGVVRWRYPAEPGRSRQPGSRGCSRSGATEQYHVGYELSSTKEPTKLASPQVVNDARRRTSSIRSDAV